MRERKTPLRSRRAGEELLVEAVRFVARLVGGAQPARDSAWVLRVLALRALSARLGAAEGGQKQDREHSDNGRDDKEFDERKGAGRPRLRPCIGELAADSSPIAERV
jgi:hypothetical protein